MNKNRISPPTGTINGDMARYKPGDMVDFSPNEKKEPHLIILAYDPATARYQYDLILS